MKFKASLALTLLACVGVKGMDADEYYGEKLKVVETVSTSSVNKLETKYDEEAMAAVRTFTNSLEDWSSFAAHMISQPSRKPRYAQALVDKAKELVSQLSKKGQSEFWFSPNVCTVFAVIPEWLEELRRAMFTFVCNQKEGTLKADALARTLVYYRRDEYGNVAYEKDISAKISKLYSCVGDLSVFAGVLVAVAYGRAGLCPPHRTYTYGYEKTEEFTPSTTYAYGDEKTEFTPSTTCTHGDGEAEFTPSTTYAYGDGETDANSSAPLNLPPLINCGLLSEDKWLAILKACSSNRSLENAILQLLAAYHNALGPYSQLSNSDLFLKNGYISFNTCYLPDYLQRFDNEIRNQNIPETFYDRIPYSNHRMEQNLEAIKIRRSYAYVNSCQVHGYRAPKADNHWGSFRDHPEVYKVIEMLAGYNPAAFYGIITGSFKPTISINGMSFDVVRKFVFDRVQGPAGLNIVIQALASKYIPEFPKSLPIMDNVKDLNLLLHSLIFRTGCFQDNPLSEHEHHCLSYVALLVAPRLTSAIASALYTVDSHAPLLALKRLLNDCTDIDRLWLATEYLTCSAFDAAMTDSEAVSGLLQLFDYLFKKYPKNNEVKLKLGAMIRQHIREYDPYVSEGTEVSFVVLLKDQEAQRNEAIARVRPFGDLLNIGLTFYNDLARMPVDKAVQSYRSTTLEGTSISFSSAFTVSTSMLAKTASSFFKAGAGTVHPVLFLQTSEELMKNYNGGRSVSLLDENPNQFLKQVYPALSEADRAGCLVDYMGHHPGHISSVVASESDSVLVTATLQIIKNGVWEPEVVLESVEGLKPELQPFKDLAAWVKLLKSVKKESIVSHEGVLASVTEEQRAAINDALSSKHVHAQHNCAMNHKEQLLLLFGALRKAISFESLDRTIPKDPQHTLTFIGAEDLFTLKSPVSVGFYDGEDHLGILSALCGIVKRPFKFDNAFSRLKVADQMSYNLIAANPQELSNLVTFVTNLNSIAGTPQPRKSDYGNNWDNHSDHRKGRNDYDYDGHDIKGDYGDYDGHGGEYDDE